MLLSVHFQHYSPKLFYKLAFGDEKFYLNLFEMPPKQNYVVDVLYIVTPIVGVCNCSMFCCTLLYVHSSFAIILIGKRELVALLSLSSWRLVMVV